MNIYSPDLILLILIVLLVLSSILLLLLALRLSKVNKEFNAIKDLRQTDIVETNKLFIEKSENELRLFFQFENVLEELIKMMRKSNSDTTKIIDNQRNTDTLLDYLIKK